MTIKKLLKIRDQITLNSLFYNDYINDYADTEKTYIFFDGYLDYLCELANEGDNFMDYDTRQNLINYFYIVGVEFWEG